MTETVCPACSSTHIKLNGHIHNGKQNRLCKDCGRQFVVDREKRLISDSDKALIAKLLLEKISLAGIARVADVSQVWLQGYVSELYAAQPDDLHVLLPTKEAMEAYLEDRFDEHVYKIEALKKRCTG
ncbi:IS1 family transposase [Pontibacter sp. 172403-2]|uniref:IS1 family transposase n=1 Tax=Pontibacter rufus TaxID=2791028 RepID=UPI0018AFBD14|nr:IS1 family transposase [Pontibacter sp. 172403-2]